MRWPSRSSRETRALARALGRSIDAQGAVVALVGPLGAGKTVFVKGLADGLGVDPKLVASPSFVIVSEYPGRRRLAHVDLFRVESEAELEATGFLDLLAPGAVVAIEWADRLPAALPSDRLQVTIEPAPDVAVEGSTREVRVDPSGPASRALAVRWQGQLERERGPAWEKATCR